MYKIEMQILQYTVDTTVDLANFKQVKDFMLYNTGTVDVTINQLFTLKPNESISFAGYENTIRTDSIDVAFAAGVGAKLTVILNKIYNC